MFMKTAIFTSRIVVVISVLLITGCLLPGKIPINPTPAGPLPVIETDARPCSKRSGQATRYIWSRSPKRNTQMKITPDRAA